MCSGLSYTFEQGCKKDEWLQQNLEEDFGDSLRKAAVHATVIAHACVQHR
jgi:hypothetical protein